MSTRPSTADAPDRSPHRRPASRPLLGLALASATVLLAGCSTSGSGTVQSAPSAAGAISRAVSSAAAAASGIPTPEVTDGGTSGGSGTDSGTGPCALLSVQQASTLGRANYSSANSADVGDIGTCDYNPGAGNPEDLTVTTTDDGFCWGALSASNGPGTSVAGVGDAAFGFSTGFDVKHGGTCIDIQGNTAAEQAGDWGPDTAMAQVILQKLG